MTQHLIAVPPQPTCGDSWDRVAVDRVAAIRDLVEHAHHDPSLTAFTERAAASMRLLFDADGVSVFLRDGGEARIGRHAVNGSATGPDYVALGEGPAGLAVATRAPVTVSDTSTTVFVPRAATCHADETYTVAAPILVESEAAGAVVVTRRGVPLSSSETELLMALTGCVAGAVRMARASLQPVEPPQHRRAGGGTRRVVLKGQPFLPGQALGPIMAQRRPPRRPPPGSPERPTAAIDNAFDAARRCIRQLCARAHETELARDASFLLAYEAILEDGRLASAAHDLVARGVSIPAALGQLASDVVRTTLRGMSDPFMAERGVDIEDLCNGISMLAVDDPRARPPSATLLVGHELTVYDLLVTARSGPVGVALTERAGGTRTRVLLRLLGLPALLDVAGLFRWVSDGDIAILDATRGFLLINPSRAEVAALRSGRSTNSDRQMSAP